MDVFKVVTDDGELISGGGHINRSRGNFKTGDGVVAIEFGNLLTGDDYGVVIAGPGVITTGITGTQPAGDGIPVLLIAIRVPSVVDGSTTGMGHTRPQ